MIFCLLILFYTYQQILLLNFLYHKTKYSFKVLETPYMYVCTSIKNQLFTYIYKYLQFHNIFWLVYKA